MSAVNDLLKRLLELPRMGSGPGLHRMAELCRELLDDPWLDGLDAIKITGSNGKGSVAAMTAAILEAAGVAVGRYTSPHLFDVGERITVGGAPISSAELADGWRWLEGERRRLEARSPGESLARFEALTAVALRHFCRRRPETVVAEAGIGGRFDPTRLFPGRLTALVSVDLEHTALLGSTREEIAYDKADLAADGSSLVVGDLPQELRRRLAGYARVRRLELLRGEEVCAVRRVDLAAPPTMRLDLELGWGLGGGRWDAVEVGLWGEHQAGNAALAIALAGGWLERHRGFSAAELEAAVRQGLVAVSWPCRLERVRTEPDVWLDAGHTPGALAALASATRRLVAERPLVLVLGVSRDKDIRAFVQALAEGLAGLPTELVVTRAHHRGAPPADVATLVRELCPDLEPDVVATIDEALPRALAAATANGGAVLVAGGLFLAVEAAAVLRGADPRALVFL